MSTKDLVITVRSARREEIRDILLGIESQQTALALALDLGMAEPLECCRNRLGPEERHLRVIDHEEALCGKGDQDGAGGGTFPSLLRWPTCEVCRVKAEAMGPHPSQSGERSWEPRLPQAVGRL